MCLIVLLETLAQPIGGVPCCTVYLAGWITLQFKTVACVWQLLETLVMFDCVPYSFAEVLLLVLALLVM